MNTIQEQWKSYANDVMPGNVSKMQFIETRRAFYAGVGAMLYILDAINRIY